MAAFRIRYVSAARGGGDGSWATPWTLAEAVTAGTGCLPGDEVRVLNDGTYSLAGNTTLANDGTAESHILWIGRKTDDSAYESAYINCVTYYFRINANFIKWFYIDCYGTATNYPFYISSAVIIYRSKFKNGNTTTTTGPANAVYLNVMGADLIECYCENSLSNNISISTSQGAVSSLLKGHIINCKIVTKNIGLRFSPAAGGAIIHGNLIIGNGAGKGVESVSNLATAYVNSITHNTIYNFNYGIYFNNLEIETAVTNAPLSIINNLFHTIKDPNPSTDPLQNGYCIYTPESVNKPNNLVKLNKYYNCDNFSNSKISACFHEIENEECTSDPFTYTDPNPSFDATHPDYSLNNVSGGGLSCKEIDAYPAFNYYWNH